MNDIISLPARVEPLGITVRWATDADTIGNRLGFWDESTGEIVIRKDQPPAGVLVILIHEAMHLAESLWDPGFGTGLPGSESEEMITFAAPIVSVVLAACGLVGEITMSDLIVLQEPTE